MLIQRAKEQVAAFGDLYERYVDRVYLYVLARIGDRFEAEDVTASVFLQALTHLSNYSDRGVPLSSWLYRIAHNLVSNWYRDHSRDPIPLETPDPIELPDLEGMLERLELGMQVRRALQALPLERQRLIVLKFVEELPNAEIGRLMGRSEGAIKALLHRTLGGLRRAFDAIDDVLA